MDLVDEVSPADITLAAQKPRRKSSRRSMIIFPTFTIDSPVHYSSPKVLVRRHSLARTLLPEPSASPIPQTHVARPFLNDSSRASKHTRTECADDECPSAALILATSPSEYAGRPPQPIEPSNKIQKIESLRQSNPDSVQVTNIKSQAVPHIIDSVDALLENYDREFSAWLAFLMRLQIDSITPLQLPQLSRDEICNNPVLGEFSDFIFPKESALDPTILQNRIQNYVRLCRTSLVRLSREMEKVRLMISGLQLQVQAEREIKLCELLLHTPRSPDLLGIKKILENLPFLREDGVNTLTLQP